MKRAVGVVWVGIGVVAGVAQAQVPTAAGARFDAYVAGVEARLGVAGPGRAAAPLMTPAEAARIRDGELVVERAGGGEVAGALLHDWRGVGFVPGATADELGRVMRDFDRYPELFAPEVVEAQVLEHQSGDEYRVRMRMRQRQVITVVLDGTYDVVFRRWGAGAGASVSRSRNIAEIGPDGRALGAGEEHGFLWRQNTYWRWEERDGGLYVEVESVSLTRSIPAGLGWAVRPLVERVPRESLTFMLGRVTAALRQQRTGQIAERKGGR